MILFAGFVAESYMELLCELGLMIEVGNDDWLLF